MMSKLSLIIASIYLAINASASGQIKSVSKTILATREFSLDNRYSVPSVNEVMKKNILLNLAYLNGTVDHKSDIDWNKLENESFEFEFSLQPGQTFAYHGNILPEYKDSLALTTNSWFGPGQGFVSDGYLFGDGVCHLASLINWAARDAGLETYVPKDHRSVAHIPDVPDDYGVSIFANPETGAGQRNNLYITNNKETEVKFIFSYDGHDLEVKVAENV